MRGTYFEESKVVSLVFKQFWSRSHLNKLDWLTPQDVYYTCSTEKPPSETDPLEELLALEQEEQESESELEEEGIVNVVDTSESDNDEVTVNPTEMEADPEIGEHMGDNTPQ